MKMGATANGNGALTAHELKAMLENIPDDAILHIRTDGDQREGNYWSVRAEWGEEHFTTRSGTKVTNYSQFGDH